MGFIESLKQTDAGSFLITLVVAMAPVIELRGAIPMGVGLGLTHWQALIASVIGNMLPAPFIILFIRRVFKWLSSKSVRLSRWIDRLTKKAEGKWDRVHRYQFWGLMILVAIPLPGTGAWTGSLIAALMDMRLKKALPSILLGVIVAGFLVTGITYGFGAIFS